MRNVLVEAQRYIDRKREGFHVGVVESKTDDGGLNVTTDKGGNEVVYGDADVNDVVLYADGFIQTVLKKETIKTSRIA